MRITELTINGYGIFHECRIEGLPAGLSLFLGDNEAGKSTVLGFIRDVFFGAPDGRSRERSYPPLRGGRWGGSLGLVNGQGERMVLDRGPGSKGGRVSLVGPQGEALSREALARLLGGTTREVFKNVYAFSLSELQTLETLNSERVRDAIYSAGLGAGLSSLPEILKSLESSREKLFKTGGQRQTINSLLSSLEEVQAKISRASGQIETFDGIVRELETLSQENERMKERLSGLRSRLSGLQSLHSLWEEWIERLEICRQLEKLPDASSFPEDGLNRYEDLSVRLARFTERRNDLAGEKETLEQRLAGLVVDQDLLEREQILRGLAEEKSRFLEAGEELQRLEPAISSRQDSLQGVLSRLGSGWSCQLIEGFDCSLKVKESIAGQARSLQELENRVSRAGTELVRRREELSKAEEALAEADKDLLAWESGSFEWNEELSASLRRERDRFAQALEELPAWRRERDRGLQEVERFLTEIDPGWTREDLERFDTSLQVRDRIEAFAKDFAARDRELLQLEQEIRSCRESSDELQERVRSREEALQRHERPRFDSLERVREVWSELRELQRNQAGQDTTEVRAQALRERINGLLREKRSLQEEPGWSRALPLAALIGLGGCGLVLGLALAGILSWALAWPPAGFLGLLALVLAGQHRVEKARTARRVERRADLDEELQSLESELEEVRQEQAGLQRTIEDIGRRIGLSQASGTEGLNAELERARELIQERRRLEDELSGLSAELQRAREKLQNLERRREELISGRTGLAEAWKEELASLGLSRNLEPAAAARLVDRVETARSELAHLREAETRLSQLEDFVRDYTQRALELPEAAGLPENRPEQLLSAVDRHLDRVERERDRQSNWQLAEKERNKRFEEREKREAERCRAAEELEQAEQVLEAQQASWRQWLDNVGLDPDLTPELAREALADIEKGQSLLSEQRELEDKREQCRCRVRDYIERIRQLAGELGRSEPEERLEVPFIESLVQELESSRADAGRGRELQQQLQEKHRALEEADDSIKALHRQIQELLDRAGVENEEEFRRLARIQETGRQLRERLQTLDRSLLRGTGQNDLATVESLFSPWTRQGIEEEISRLTQDIEEAESRRQEVSSRIGELRAERSRLASDDDIARLRQEEESLKEELQQAAFRWSRYSLAVHLLRRAKETYEREQQPQVVQTAGRYLAEITGGAYTGVFAPLGESEVFAVDRDGLSKRPEDLSRGTAEQLYLSLRFGYVDNAGRQGERLPVIMDDILVNFDRTRAARAAAAISELAGRNQVLYFTCHPETLDLFRQSAPQAPVFELGNGAIRRREAPS